MARSLRLRLQLWHALTLLLVIAGFGTGLYYHVRQAQLGSIDGELEAAARVLEGTLHGFPPHILEGREEPSRPPPPPPVPPEGSPRKPPPPPGPGPRDSRQREHLLGRLILPASLRHRYEENPEEAPYFAIWLANGQRLAGSPLPAGAEPLHPPAGSSGTTSFRTWQRGPFREGALLGPNRSLVLVGRRVEREMQAMNWFAGHIVTIGLIVLAVGLTGGWLLSRGALRPIERMSAAAASITATNLSRRIDVTGVDRELATLAGILNDMFARLQSAFERQARFTADASHELRTPLAIIHSHAELALARPRSPEEYRDALETSLRAARRMRGLVDGLLTLARVDAGNLDIQRQEIDLGVLVQESADLLVPLAEEKHVALRVSADSVEMTGDPGRLNQVITNLLTNAIHYNHPGGDVAATVAASEQDVVLKVADTGCGIPEEDAPHIFERFYRVDRARSRGQGGCGLGLAICKSIVEAHGGTIGFSSEEGQGTTFFVRLPGKTTSEKSDT
jgi:heavy metal sensor kinase